MDMQSLMISISADWFLWPGIPLLILSGFLLSLGFDIWEVIRSIERNNRHGD